jgi:hypothetical protein
MTAVAEPVTSDEHWEALPGWVPVYRGLSRYRKGLIWRLVLVVVGYLATALAIEYGPPWFVKATLGLVPLLTLATTAVLLHGLMEYRKLPARAGSRRLATICCGAFAALLAFETAHAALGLSLIETPVPSPERIALVGRIWYAGHLIGLGCLVLFLTSLREVARFVGAAPLLGRFRGLFIAIALVALGVAFLMVYSHAIAAIGRPALALGGSMVLAGAVGVMGEVITLVADLRDCLFLTTAEFAAVRDD